MQVGLGAVVHAPAGGLQSLLGLLVWSVSFLVEFLHHFLNQGPAAALLGTGYGII
jgi:hypothetical protein